MESVLKLFNWGFCLLVVILATLNAIYVHPAIGVGLFVLSLAYVPPMNKRLQEYTGFTIPPIAKILLGMVIIWASMVVTEVMDKAGF